MTITEATYAIQDILNKYEDGEEISDKDNAEIDRLEASIKAEITEDSNNRENHE